MERVDMSEKCNTVGDGGGEQTSDGPVAIVYDPDTGDRAGQAENEEVAEQMEAANWEVEWVNEGCDKRDGDRSAGEETHEHLEFAGMDSGTVEVAVSVLDDEGWEEETESVELEMPEKSVLQLTVNSDAVRLEPNTVDGPKVDSYPCCRGDGGE